MWSNYLLYYTTNKASTTNHGTIYFNNVSVIRENVQKH